MSRRCLLLSCLRGLHSLDYARDHGTNLSHHTVVEVANVHGTLEYCRPLPHHWILAQVARSVTEERTVLRLHERSQN